MVRVRDRVRDSPNPNPNPNPNPDPGPNPNPDPSPKSTQAYMEHLAVLMNNIPRALLVAGQKDADVITMYS